MLHLRMGRPQREDAKNRSVRLPTRLWELIERAASDRDIYANNLLWRMAEDFLVKHGYLKKADRKREPLR